MPSNLEKRGDGPRATWYLRVMIGGKLYRKSTGRHDLDGAKRRAREIEKDIRDGRMGWKKDPVPTFAAWADKYLRAYHQGRRTEETLLRRPRQLWGDRLLDKIAASDCKEYLANREQDGAKPGTLERERVLLKALFRAAVQDGLIPQSPAAALKAINPPPRTRVMSVDEERAIRAHLSPVYNRLLTVALTTGLRSGELHGACPADLRENGMWLWVRPELNKTRKGRLVPLRPETRQALAIQAEARVGDEQHPVTDTTPYFQLGHSTAHRRLQTVCNRLGISPSISIHDLRRTFATRCAQAGMYPKHLQQILGHQSIEMTMKFYTHMSQASMREAMEKVGL